MPAPITCWAPAQSHSVSTQCQLASTWISINSASSWLPLPSDKSHLDKWLLKKNGCLAVCATLWCRSQIGAHTVANSLRQKSSWICLSISFSLLCINPQALICTLRGNQWKSFLIWVGTIQVFLLLLTWNNRHFAGSAYGIGKECQKSSGLSLACLLPVACKDGNPKDWPAWAKMFN